MPLTSNLNGVAIIAMSDTIYIKTRKLRDNELDSLKKWLAENLLGSALINGITWDRFFKSYSLGSPNKKARHQFKVHFASETDAKRFMMDWA